MGESPRKAKVGHENETIMAAGDESVGYDVLPVDLFPLSISPIGS